MNHQDILLLDESDPLGHKRAEFELPGNIVYLDGNSLGPLSVAARRRAMEVVTQQWGRDLIGSWNLHDWIDLPVSAGEKIAPLIGAAAGQTICCDSVSVNLFKLLSAALALQPGRTVVLAQQEDFPTDLYMVEGLGNLLGSGRCRLVTVEESAVESRLDDTVAVLLLSQVNFRTGRLHDIKKLTRLAHEKGALVLWDLSHSAGVLPLALDEWEVDLAVGCGYKYLNGGPGAPAFIYVAQRLQQDISQPLSGWMGHEAPFGFRPAYEPAQGIGRFLAGTPPVLSMSTMDAALDVFRDVDAAALRAKSATLQSLFLQLADEEPSMAQLTLLTPTDSESRGAQLAYRHAQAFALCQALIAHGVIADFREPDILRLGFSPLYLRYQDVWHCVKTLADILEKQLWREPRYSVRSRVT